MIDWLTALIAGIIILAIGYIIRRVVADPPIQKLGLVLEVIGAVIIVIAFILLLVMYV